MEMTIKFKFPRCSVPYKSLNIPPPAQLPPLHEPAIEAAAAPPLMVGGSRSVGSADLELTPKQPRPLPATNANSYVKNGNGVSNTIAVARPPLMAGGSGSVRSANITLAQHRFVNNPLPPLMVGGSRSVGSVGIVPPPKLGQHRSVSLNNGNRDAFRD